MKSAFLTMIKEHMVSCRYAKQTINSYLYWIASFIRFNGMRHPSCMSDEEVERFLYHANSQP